MKTLIEIILYVENQAKSRDFYAFFLQQDPVLDVPGMTEFLITKDTKLGLMPESSIAKILQDKTPHPASGSGVPRCELYLLLDEPENYIKRLEILNASPISPLKSRDWGHDVAYFADPDGHIIALAKTTSIAL